MTINSQLDNLQEKDIYSLMLFVLFKLHDSKEYSALSELAYILDKDNLLRFLEYFGGLQIAVPTIDDLEVVLEGLFLYLKVNIEHKDYTQECNNIDKPLEDKRKVIECYEKIIELLKDYTFEARNEEI